jgi:hypothetical protein
MSYQHLTHFSERKKISPLKTWKDALCLLIYNGWKSAFEVDDNQYILVSWQITNSYQRRSPTLFREHSGYSNQNERKAILLKMCTHRSSQSPCTIYMRPPYLIFKYL